MYKPSKAHEQDFWHVFVIKVCFGNSPRCIQTCTVFICSLAGAIPKIIPIYIGLKKIVKIYQYINIYFTPLKSNLPWLKSWFQKKLWSRDFYCSTSSFLLSVQITRKQLDSSFAQCLWKSSEEQNLSEKWNVIIKRRSYKVVYL